jgi:hypothetical protein
MIQILIYKYKTLYLPNASFAVHSAWSVGFDNGKIIGLKKIIKNIHMQKTKQIKKNK